VDDAVVDDAAADGAAVSDELAGGAVADEAAGGAPAGGAPADDAVVDEAASGRKEGGDMPVAGLGVDIIEIERMERALERTPRMRVRLFSEAERAYAQGKARPAVHLALFFAAKEAVLKALGTGFSGMAFGDVEVGHDRFGRPIPLLHGHAQEVARAQGIVEIQLSLSYTRSVGVASAVAIKEQDRPRKDEKVDARVELARQFKEVRALLDDMDERIHRLDEGQGDEPPTEAPSADPEGDGEAAG
jgi:holo-[acyl-carrier protein] synthase